MAATPVVIVVIVAMVAAAMGDLLQRDFVVPFEDSRIWLVQLIKNSGALGNTGNRAAGSGHACKCHCPRNAKHSSKKLPTFHKNLSSC
ncbi:MULTISPECIES: hypothetical protein [unclassified Mesorhizobium]|uniref:hypothetical protein n=1 Tax=unclassified Mesorhizobium TaxID=325217 RepID=UPI00167AD888|nr:MULTISPECIES: hypothetical protein [unclassified Mesorhizobium]